MNQTKLILRLSHTRARGRALGHESARDVWKSLSDSEAAKSGLLEDLEDTILMVEGIAEDIVSDIATNIIREPLINYTQDACAAYGIPLAPEVNSGPLWDPRRAEWSSSSFVQLPLVNHRRLLLVPKIIVRQRPDYNLDEYYRHYVLEDLRAEELSANTELVHVLRDGRRRVTKKDLEEKYGRGKGMVIKHTLRHPELLERYRSDKRRRIGAPLNHWEIAEIEGTDAPDWDALLAAVTDVTPGKAQAHVYEGVIEQLLTAIFYPSLAYPKTQHEIHQGRKRIDITYTNTAQTGFFKWLMDHYPAPHVFVECKNYGREVGNPELDQLSGRFSPTRGKFGLLICRSFQDKDLFFDRCRDTANDNRGFIVPLDDEDLKLLTHAYSKGDLSKQFVFFKANFNRLIM